MEPLDLTANPPRSPRERIGGMVMLARTIDKLRATLPGGSLGQYQISGFSSRMLEMLGISEEDLRDVVARARDEDEVVAWVLAHSDEASRESVDANLGSLRIADRLDREGFADRYPQVRELPPETSLFEMLEDDDRRMFSSPA